jgi:Tol biopolymer transport system component
MLTKSGVKLLDFGLAKAVAPVSTKSSMSALPTITPNLTQEGTILGTFQYMAPEQLEGKETDGRTDIFAFGAVLYEMATGRKAFEGKSQASLIGAILRDEPPPISVVQPMTPPALDRVVKTCLAKDPEDRWQTARDVLLQLKWIQEGGSQAGLFAPAAARRRNRERLAWVAAAAGVATALALAAVLVSRTPDTRRTVQSSILPPEKAVFAFENGPVAVSPDGSRLAFVARAADGKSALWVRPLTGLSAQTLPGTDGASHPFWSPDSRLLGFFAGGKLKKIEASGGPPQTICDAPSGRGGTWNRKGVILFAPMAREGILQVSSAGGIPSPATRLDETRQESGHRLPVFLPDGRHFLFLSISGPERRLVCGSLGGRETRELLRVNSNFSYVEPGYLLFLRERTLFAQRFDAKRIELRGEAFPVGEQIQYFPDRGFGVFSASNDGTLVYQRAAGAPSQMVWTDRGGKPTETVGPPGLYRCPRLSRDGRRVAVDIEDPQTGRSDIWVYDLSRRVFTRLTFGPADNTYPVWSPDDRIAFMSTAKSRGDIVVKPSSGSGAEEFLTGSDTPGTRSDEAKFTDHWSRDGCFLAFHTSGVKTGADLWMISMADRKPALFLATPAAQVLHFFSPDGRWIVYQSNESGKFEIYVRPFPQPGGKWQVSTGGGHFPVWSADGKEIFYVGDDNRLTAVPVRTESGIELGTPEPLFEVRLRSVLGRAYDVSADGKRFLLNTSLEDVRSVSLTLVQNWAADLKR